MSSSRPAARSRGLRKPPEADLGFSWGRTNNVLLGIGVALLALGYLALSRRSITLAPLLLVVGYCVFIPASLVLRRRDRGTGE
jgi:hypothetical protein